VLIISGADKFPKESVNFREMTKYLGDADDSQVFGINDDLAASGAHTVSACAEKLKRRIRNCGAGSPTREGRATDGRRTRFSIGAAQGLNQLRAVHFARGFAGGDQDLHGDIVL
jgi:hypothetical protein